MNRSAAVAAYLALMGLSCGGRARPAEDAVPALESRWQDVFDVSPEVLLVVRPGALRDNRLYGPLLRRVEELARQRSRVVAATRAIDAIEDSDEVLVALRSIPGDDQETDDFVAVVLGVRADIDPATLVDGDGRPLWTAGPNGRVRELLRDRDEQGLPLQASLFELPGRTWVIASGDAQARARDAFARPRGRADPALLDADALALVRIDGRSFAARIPALRPPSALSALGRGLESVSFELTADPTRPIQALLAYSSPGAAAAAERVARDAVEAIRREKPRSVAWIGDGTVARPAAGARVMLSVPLPPGLLASLLRLDGAGSTAKTAAPRGE